MKCDKCPEKATYKVEYLEKEMEGYKPKLLCPIHFMAFCTFMSNGLNNLLERESK